MDGEIKIMQGFPFLYVGMNLDLIYKLCIILDHIDFFPMTTTLDLANTSTISLSKMSWCLEFGFNGKLNRKIKTYSSI